MLSEFSLLVHTQTNCTTYQLVPDHRKYAVGAALHQVINGNPIPVEFFSKKLTQAQIKYSTFDQKLLTA